MKTADGIYGSSVLLVLLVFSFSGCAGIKEKATETAKVMWGSSTKDLEELRSQANSKTFSCALDDCRNQVLGIAKEESLKIFIDNPQKGLIVMMGFPDIINTTEVGVFLSSVDTAKTKIEITSMSPHAQLVGADFFFPKLQKIFTEAP